MRVLAPPVAVAFVGAPIMAEDAVRPLSSEEQSLQDITVSSIQVVDVEDLSSDLSSQIDEHAANTTEEEMQSLRHSIDATSQAVAALKKKQRTFAQVVAITVDENGVLTIFTTGNPSE